MPSNRNARLRTMIDEHLKFVARTLRTAGVPASDLDDEIQRTFMVAANRIDDVEVGAERSFLIGVAYNLAMRARRTLARRREILEREPPERIETIATPEFFAERKQMRQLCDNIVGTLHEPLRAVFTLSELEEMNMSEVAEVLGLPRGTVASRLRRARQQFRQHIAAVNLGGAFPRPEISDRDQPRLREPAGPARPARLRWGRQGALERALLAAGMSVRATASTHARTLLALGLTGPDAV